MKITELSIKRSAGMTTIVMLFVVLGLVGYWKMSSDLFPKYEAIYVAITTTYPGAGPQEIESQIVDPIEEAVSSISGLKRVTSTAAEGLAWTVLEYRVGTNSDTATNDTQKAVDSIYYKLPEDAEKPVVRKLELNAEPIMTLVLSSDLPLTETYRLADERIKQRLETIPGVARAVLQGGKEREIQVNIDRARLEGYGLSINQVVSRLTLENRDLPGGRIVKRAKEYNVRLLGQFSSLEEIKNLQIPVPGGGSIPLRSFADVQDSYKEVRELSRLDNQEAVGILVQKQSDASIVDTAAAVREEVLRLQKTLPKGTRILIPADSSTFVSNSLNDTKRTLLEGVLMTGLVLMFFLREWRSLVTVILAIPTSIISTFMVMYFCGYTFNMFSLTALSLCVGILVDDSIVVLENIHRHLKMGKSPFQAALDGRREIGMAAVAITLSDVVVFGPMAFMQGIVGQFFREFGMTVIFATLFSLFISFTLTPMLAAKLFRQSGPSVDNDVVKSGTLLQLVSKKFVRLGTWVTDIYRPLLIWSLANRWKVFGLVFLALVASIGLYSSGSIGAGFIAKTDTGNFSISMELAPGTSLEQTNQTFRQVEAKLARIPEVEHYYTALGQGGSVLSAKSGSNIGKISVVLKPKAERKRTVWEITDQVRSWGRLIDADTYTVTEGGLPVISEDAPIQVEVSGPDGNALVEIADKVEKVVKATPGVTDVVSSWQGLGRPEFQVKIDRVRAAELGLSVAEISQAVRTAMEGDVATLYRDQGKEYDLRVRLLEKDRASELDLNKITLVNSTGQTIRLNQVASVREAAGPLEIRHKNRDHVITISAGTTAAVGTLADQWDKTWAKMALPPGYQIDYYGSIQYQRESFSDLAFVLLLSLLLIYMVLIVLYESYLTPVIRMLSLPCGLIGALAALAVTRTNLDIMSFIGIIMLDGLAAKNGTLLIDYTNTLMERGMSLREALLEAGTTRLRPIFMTSVTMIFGMLPTALAFADGAEIRRGMGIVLVGGLITSTVLTPIVIPVAYTLVDDAKKLLRKARRISVKEAVQ